MATSQNGRMTREDFRKAKELEELRKTGAAPPELDEEGRMINPHVPQYISRRPWYVEDSKSMPGLKHQRPDYFKQNDFLKDISKVEKRGLKKSAATKFRKGACQNCGAVTHKTKECVERPRKKGAKWTKSDIRPDEYIPEALAKDFDGKRDRWHGYNPAEYTKVIKRFDKLEDARREVREAEWEADKERERALKEERRQKRREKKEKKKLDALVGNADGEKADSDDDSESDSDLGSDGSSDEEDGLKDSLGAQITKLDGKQRTTVRNLRIREDTAKYLLNLDVNSAYYDPKSRSMRANPLAHTGKGAEDLPFAGDNFVRTNGDVRNVRQLQSFVWQANEKGNEDINLIANPSQAEKMFQQFQEKKSALKETKKSRVLDKYGGSEHMKAPDKRLIFAQSESYVEYAPDGTVIKGQEEAIPKTKYAEDVMENNHTSVWGSFYKDGKWGYKCCHQVLRRAYCTGAAGKGAAAKLKANMEKRMAQAGDGKNNGKDEEDGDEGDASSSDSDSEHDEDGNSKRKGLSGLAFSKNHKPSKKFKQSLAAPDKNELRAPVEDLSKKSSTGGLDTVQPDAEQMEAYRRNRVLEEDPMANFGKK